MGDEGNEEEGRVSLLLYSLALDYDCWLTNRAVRYGPILSPLSPPPVLSQQVFRWYIGEDGLGWAGSDRAERREGVSLALARGSQRAGYFLGRLPRPLVVFRRRFLRFVCLFLL